MKKTFLFLFLIISSFTFAQKQSFWKTTTPNNASTIVENKKTITKPQLFSLDFEALQQALSKAPKRFEGIQKSEVVVSFPNPNDTTDSFYIFESSNMNPALAAKYPNIKSYVGSGINNPNATIYFSISPLGIQTMVLETGKTAVFIEPYTTDLKTYVVYKKTDKTVLSSFECKVADDIQSGVSENFAARPNADDGFMRTYRLAISVTGEYAAYFGGTVPLALAAINNTMTRVNGVFEKDFGVRMNLIENNDILIYLNAGSDPYSPAASKANWNVELQNTLTSVIGNAGYDIGHLFGGSGGGGNAGCIGCICVDDTASLTDKNKGSGYTSPSDGIPSGDNFDIDYVAHEMGHQFGGNHTFTHSTESGSTVQMEPGSGSTIMGYAGITSLDVQPHSDAYFHAITIQQVTNNIKTKLCSVNTATGNAIPTANAGTDFTIPKSTPFMLTGAGTDANGDTLTYNWEQMDTGNSSSSTPSATKTTGPNFRSYNSSTSPIRYFPKMSSVLTGATTTAGSELTVEALSSVARTLNFRVTVRDNNINGPANNSDDMVVTVNASAGPFLVTAPNTAVSFTGNTTQTITWDVAGTTANGVNCANVDILLSTNGGTTFPITLLASTPNDGTQTVVIPNVVGTTNRIMIKGTNHIFYDVSNTNFTIINGVADTTPPSAPVVSASGTTDIATSLSWTAATDNIGVTSYNVYKNGVLLTNTAATNFNVTGLSPSTAYTFTVKAKDAAGNISLASNSLVVNTLAPDTIAPTAPTLNASGTTITATTLSWSGATDTYGVTGYDVYQNGALIGSTSLTTYPVSGLSASSTYTFYVKAKDAANNISIASNTVSVTTLQPNYCPSQGNVVTDELIGNVTFGTINNTSTGGTGYTDFTAIATNITMGTSQTISITPTWTGTIYDEGYAVFIDYNRDGDFDDAGEIVFTNAASKTTPVIGTFTIPVTANPGVTRMRVSLKYNGIPTACETFSYGQVEDYTVILTSSAETTLNLKLFIEGFYDNSSHDMRPVMANQGIGSSTTDVDTITVELRDANTFELVASTDAVLQTDGNAVCTYPSAPSGSFYIAVKHRNTVQTWSASPLTFGASPVNYDFTNLVSKAYGSNMIQVEPNVWAFYSGDINDDGLIDLIDYSIWESDYLIFGFGYLITDLNGDGLVDLNDYTFWEGNYLTYIFSVTP